MLKNCFAKPSQIRGGSAARRTRRNRCPATYRGTGGRFQRSRSAIRPLSSALVCASELPSAWTKPASGTARCKREQPVPLHVGIGVLADRDARRGMRHVNHRDAAVRATLLHRIGDLPRDVHHLTAFTRFYRYFLHAAPSYGMKGCTGCRSNARFPRPYAFRRHPRPPARNSISR